MRLRGRVAVGLALALVAAGVIAGGVATEQHVVAAFAIVDIDDYPRRTDVTACANPVVGKPGVVAFRAMILSQVGGRDDGMAVCKKIANASRSYSDHADGRAWDWHMVASDRSDVATVDRVLDWLLRTDERGQRNAMARRIGLTYIIWNHEYYRVGADDAHWVPYTAPQRPPRHPRPLLVLGGWRNAPDELVEPARAVGLATAGRTTTRSCWARAGRRAPMASRARWSGTGTATGATRSARSTPTAGSSRSGTVQPRGPRDDGVAHREARLGAVHR